MVLLLLPHLFLCQLLSLSILSSSNMLDPHLLDGDSQKNNSCSLDIPYPFGIAGTNNSINNSIGPGFDVLCNNNGSPMLSLKKNHTYEILNISLDGYVRILGRSIASHCYDKTSGRLLHPDHFLRLDNTPYTFSTRNKFTAIGCDALALIEGSSGGAHNYTGGCVSYCASHDSIIDGSCSGVGCCQASFPRGLKSFRLNFSSIRSLAGSTKNDTSGVPCSRAFIVDQDSYVFSTSDLVFGQVGDERRPVVLDWAIGEETCVEVNSRNNGSDSVCKEHSYCYDSSNGAGYRCKCCDGYTGNPYLGCEDIDECSGPNNTCIWKCVNKPGSFRCKCPLGTSGDGIKGGTGCKRDTPLEIGLGVGLALLVILVIGSSWTYWGLKQRKVMKLKQRNFFQNGGLLLQQRISSREAIAKIFSTEELKTATNNFNESRILGRGGYGTVYKGILSDQRIVAIKKSKLVDESQIEQFINEVVILSQIKHKNVVKLLGCCLETEVPLLVYEFISNGTLFHYIHNENTTSSPLSWERRMTIAVETAGALAYLHSVASTPIIHRDVKSANILLDENYTAKVSDFGASRLVPRNQTHITTLVQGTLGYLDPEYFHTSQLTDKSDVYSFGVVLVELLTGEKPISSSRSETERNLACHFIMLVENNRLLEVIDPQTVEEFGVRQLYAVAQVARKCLSLKAEERPTMKEVAIELDALRRLLKQHLARRIQWEESSSRCNPLRLNSSNETWKYSMESHMLMSMDSHDDDDSTALIGL